MEILGRIYWNIIAPHSIVLCVKAVMMEKEWSGFLGRRNISII
jgi:hypothetical protein